MIIGLSQAELEGRADQVIPFLPTSEWLASARKSFKKQKPVLEVYKNIWRGSFPQIALDKKMPRDLFYHSYIQTYVQRDVQDMLHVTDHLQFKRFLRAIAARTAQLLNYSDIARDIDIDHKTAKSWLSILEASGLV